jgi:hypothetical protein
MVRNSIMAFLGIVYNCVEMWKTCNDACILYYAFPKTRAAVKTRIPLPTTWIMDRSHCVLK